LPNSSTKLECFQELLVLLWKFLEENPLFMTHVLTKCNINELVVPICFLMYKSRRDPAQIGLVHICTFCLLKLSGERSFGVALNKPFTKKLPTDLPLFSGGHHDLLTITLHKLVVNGAYKLVPLYSCFLTIICNVSPYWRSMSLVAAVKLVNLFELFSSPKFLYSGEHAHRHLALLLEVFNNVIQYQYHGNTHLVYALIRRKDSFGRLGALTLKRAQEQCHKAYGDHTRSEYDADVTRRVERMDPKGLPNAGAMMGGDEFGFGTVVMIAEGCIMARVCHMNRCPVGVATQKEELRKKFPGTPEHVANFFLFVAEEVRVILAALGFKSLEELCGRCDLLRRRREHSRRLPRVPLCAAHPVKHQCLPAAFV